MFELFSKLGRRRSSKDVAKDRLKLVLIHDRSNVPPHLLEMMKNDILKVIQNYVEVDIGELDIQLTRTVSEDGHGVVPALIANIPIKSVKNSGR